jgi:hypothetical protein
MIFLHQLFDNLVTQKLSIGSIRLFIRVEFQKKYYFGSLAKLGRKLINRFLLKFMLSIHWANLKDFCTEEFGKQQICYFCKSATF